MSDNGFLTPAAKSCAGATGSALQCAIGRTSITGDPGGTASAGRVLERANYWAFLSHSHRDARWGAWLHKALESYRPPKPLVGTHTQRGPVPARLSPIFRDREELASATDLGASINDALSRSLCQIVICSPSSARSRWVNEEILAFKRLGREDRIFCFIVDGEPNASDDPAQAHLECFPPALRYRLGADGALSSIRTEPIAADARAGKDRRGNARRVAGSDSCSPLLLGRSPGWCSPAHWPPLPSSRARPRSDRPSSP